MSACHIAPYQVKILLKALFPGHRNGGDMVETFSRSEAVSMPDAFAIGILVFLPGQSVVALGRYL